MTENMTEVEKLTKALDEGYTGLPGFTVRDKFRNLEITKLPSYDNAQPITLNLSANQLETLYNLAKFIEGVDDAERGNTRANYIAQDLLHNKEENVNNKKAGW